MDIETRDPNLKESGPGDIRKDGYIVGVSLAVDGFKRYYPIRHEGGGNCDREIVLRYVRTILDKVKNVTGANLYYDLGWLRSEGVDTVPFQFKIQDTQLLEPLIDEEQQHYSLEALSQKYLGVGKSEDELKEAAKEFGYKDVKANIWQMPADRVGTYAEDDADLPLKILVHQQKIIAEQDLHEIVALEQDVFWVALEMRRQGIRVDLDTAVELNTRYLYEESAVLVKICEAAGFELNPWSGDDMLRLFVQENLQYPLTPGGNPSFEADFLVTIEHPLVQSIVEYRRINKMRRDFIDGGALAWQINGRIHPEIHPLRDEKYGTRTGRFSYSRPNLQQIPARDPLWGPMIRGLYLPEIGGRWARLDYSQQEPRLTVHFAGLRGFPKADLAVKKYNEDPNTDYHQYVADMANIARRPAKDLNLGMTYGMGVKKIISSLNMPNKEAWAVYNRYHDEFPYIKRLADEVSTLASERGYIKTIGGRRKRFDKWNPVDWELRKKANYRAYNLSEAQEKWPDEPLCRAFTHKGLNNLIQGSGADVTKRAMVDCAKAGFFPLLQVHDELDFSIVDDKEAADIKVIMESAYKSKMLVPLRTDLTIGKNWGECK